MRVGGCWKRCLVEGLDWVRKTLPKRLPQQPTSPSIHQENVENPTVLNLSSRNLSPTDELVLNKGLSFATTPKLNAINLLSDTVHFTRYFRWQVYFSGNNTSDPSCPPPSTTSDQIIKKFALKSNREPKSLPANHPVEIFCNSLLNKVSSRKFIESLTPTPNLTPQKFKSIKDLCSDRSIFITKADKSSTIVLLNTTDYIKEAN
ncbi:uncharacterized protein LOC120352687 [Nilaparvata lugens]|uniref:uncharacterized protein LOC120352687 n=1 Tax=Nilaparvata lugens TaxID=108931 RepID=UPI00193CA63E|nr:uncharacterized protein LOC120352687 [Nilaparvata lugens]